MSVVERSVLERPETHPSAAPPRATRRRRALAWALVALVVVLGVVVSVASASTPDRVPWGPDDPSPVGSKAFVQVLRDRGVTVTPTDTFAATRDAIRSRADTTIVLVDPDGNLADARLSRLASLAAHVVLIQPGFTELRALAPGVSARGAGSGTASGCRFGGLAPSDRVRADGLRYIASAAASAESCLGTPDLGYGLVRSEITAPGGSRTRIDVVGAASALQNGHALEGANAAYGLALTGETSGVVWYLPGVRDIAGGSDLPTDLLPAWWPPVAALLSVVLIAAAIWRGRRFGPLAIENLPVVVPASETMEGRARLYARASARLHALDALRIGSLDRLASACGLPRAATVDEVTDATATATGRPRGDLAALLRDTDPADDAELVRLAGALQDLETEVHERMNP